MICLGYVMDGWVSSFNVMSRLGTERPGFYPWQGKGFFSSPSRPKWL